MIRRHLTTLLLFVASAIPLPSGAQPFCPGVAPWVFADVQASDSFCTYVTWMAQSGVTLGCQVIDASNRLYCPDDSVTRKQMAAFMKRQADAVMPLTCAAGQVMKWNGAAWTCSDDNIGGSGGGGTVTSVLAGTGLQASPNPIVGAGSINLATSYQLPQSCANGQVPKSNGTGGWTCGADNAGTGTVTSVIAGAGLSGGNITSAGTLAVDTGAIQSRVIGTCPAGSSIRAIAANGTVTCEDDNGGPANVFVQGGNAFGATAVIGTTDNNALDIRVNGARVMRFEPGDRINNIIGGNSINSVASGVRGATIAGGGSNTTGIYPNRVTGDQGTVGGGASNTSGLQAAIGGGVFNAATGDGSTVAGGTSNQALAQLSAIGGGNNNESTALFGTVGGGNDNAASGLASAIPGGSRNVASGDYSFAAGRRAKTFAAAPHPGAFVWADTNDFDFNSSAANEFAVRATGGVRFRTAVDASGGPTREVRFNPNSELEFGSAVRQMLNLWGSAFGVGVQDATMYFRTGIGATADGGFSWFKGGVHNDSRNNAGTGGVELMRLASNGTLFVTGGTVGTLSDRASKRAFAAVDPAQVLEKAIGLPVAKWSYIANPGARHIGPTAQDFRAAFGLGDDERSIATVDADGVALSAIQGLNAKLEAKIAEQAREHTAQLARRDADIQTLREGLARQRAEIADLRATRDDVAMLKVAMAELLRERGGANPAVVPAALRH
jgi:hypothetical protein